MQMKVTGVIFAFLFTFTGITFARDEMVWNFFLEDRGNGEIALIADVSIKEGWHIYDAEIPDDGPMPTQISFDLITGAEPVGRFHATGKQATVKYDDIFQMNIGTFAHSARFEQRLKVTDRKKFSIRGDVRAQACDDSTCTPPLPNDFTFTAAELPALQEAAAAPAPSSTTTSSAREAEEIQATPPPAEPLDASATGEDAPADVTPTDVTPADSDLLWTPVIEELREFGMKGSTAGMSLLRILITGFLGGLIALITPCVWPMIPMTVSFFLKRNRAERKKAVAEALTYG
ncbi:MAG: thiol:disulfide interchange protein, partial [Proteiniphilum sp.]|nr:thiol:disulfide interchange protein [Proteiniphilum sp.]